MTNIIEYLEKNALLYPDKPAFCEESGFVSYAYLQNDSKKIASCLAEIVTVHRPVAILLEKSVLNIKAMFGVMYAGCFYVQIDTKMPISRIQKIFDNLQPAVVITDKNHFELAKALTSSDHLKIVDIRHALTHEINDTRLLDIRKKHIDQDLAYILYTSGSTGIPKGVAISHKALIAYIQWVLEAFHLDCTTVFGSQTPLYFSMSVTDVYGTIASGGTYWIIDQHMFMFPLRLTEWMNKKKINTIYWVPSAYNIAFKLHTFSKIKPQTLKLAMFAGEVMPPAVLQYWKDACGNDTLFANLFGPTETTDICSFYIIPADWQNNGKPVPIGEQCTNLELLLIKEDGCEADFEEEGELYVRGTFLASGYYGDTEKTDLYFVQNPLQNKFPEKVYRTGDIAIKDSKGILHYKGRKDNQIKHMGYRIDLGEIEAAASIVQNGMFSVLYDSQSDKIKLFYTCDTLDAITIKAALKEKLPAYMIPSDYIYIPEMPLNRNGKIDRKKLTELSKQSENTSYKFSKQEDR